MKKVAFVDANLHGANFE
ncbi:MAG: hypothetical protein AB2776_11815, partial [Candidatus Thiodiazotropha endolucinida]